MRPISGLRHVEILSARPKILPKSQPLAGSRAAGRAYEKKFQKELKRRFSGVKAGTWFSFVDTRGRGLAQPDAYIEAKDMVIVFECKLSERLEAWDQLEFYAKILSHYYGKPVAKIQVCKHLNYTASPVRSFEDLRDGAVFHWLP